MSPKHLIAVWSIFAVLAAIVCAQENRELKLVVQISRPGARSPLSYFTNEDASQWPVPAGRLTPNGAAQEYAAGSHMRAKYVAGAGGFLSDVNFANAPDKIYVRSADSTDALQSAQYLLAGMFTPQNASSADALQVPIHTAPAEQDTMLRVSSDADYCPFFNQSLSAHYKDTVFQNLNTQYNSVFAYWNQITGVTRDIFTIYELTDYIVSYEVQGLALPWPNVDKSMVDQLFQAYTQFLLNQYPTSLLQITSGNLLQDIVNRWSLVQSDNTEVKFVLYSASSSVLQTLLQVLGKFNGTLPPFGSSITIELYKVEIPNVQTSWALNFYYDGVLFKPAQCTDEDCNLDSFKTAYASYMLQDPNDWYIKCGVKAAPNNKTFLYATIGLGIGAGLLVLITCAALVGLCYVCVVYNEVGGSRWQRRKKYTSINGNSSSRR